MFELSRRSYPGRRRLPASQNVHGRLDCRRIRNPSEFMVSVINKFLRRLIKGTIMNTNDAAIGVGRVNFGDLRRLKPISVVWGFDRGRPVDRYYIEQFL